MVFEKRDTEKVSQNLAKAKGGPEMGALKSFILVLCLLVGITSVSCAVEGYTFDETDGDIALIDDPLAIRTPDGTIFECDAEAGGCNNPNAECATGPLSPPDYCRWISEVPDGPWGSTTGGPCRTYSDCSGGGDSCVGGTCVAPATSNPTDDDDATDTDTIGDDDDATDTDTGGFDCSQCFENETCNFAKERCEIDDDATDTGDDDDDATDTTTDDDDATDTTTDDDDDTTDTTTDDDDDTTDTTTDDDDTTDTGDDDDATCIAGSKEFRGDGREVGTCTREYRVCGPDGTWGLWQDAVPPTEEIPDGKDNDCDGSDDEGFPCKAKLLVGGELIPNQRACEGAPTEICFAGVQTCELTSDGAATQWGACVGRVEACVGGATCQRVDDVPVCACPEALPDSCPSTCVDKASDEANCGACGNVCATGEVCALGVCSTPSVAPAATMEFTVISPAGLDMTGKRFRGTQTVVGQSEEGATEWKLTLPMTAKFQIQIVTTAGAEVLDSFGNPFYVCRLEKKGGKEEFWATGQNDPNFAFKGLKAYDAEGKPVVKPWKVVSTDKAPVDSPQFVGQCEFSFDPFP